MRIIQKPWGHEEIWAETDKYVGKYLHITANHRLSKQYHEKKEETIRIISGLLSLEIGSGDALQEIFMFPGDVYHIYPNTIHRFCAVSENVVLVEVSTTELDDVIRISDDYERK